MDAREEAKEASDQQRDERSFSTPLDKMKSTLHWIPNNCSFSSLKPVIRSSVAAWVALILFPIRSVESILDKDSLFILMAAFASPPSETIAGVLEQEFLVLFFVTLSWAWSCLATLLANLARTTFDRSASDAQIFSGQYLETGPSVIYAIFLFIGSAFILVIRTRKGSGPYDPASFFGCICLDTSMTLAPLYPYPNYLIGQTIVIPLAAHAVLSILAALLIFPESVNSQFVDRLKAALNPLVTGVNLQHELLKKSPLSASFNPNPIAEQVAKSESAFASLAASARLVNRDICWGRFNGDDLRKLQASGLELMARAAGMACFFRALDTQRPKFPETPLPSLPVTPNESRGQSRAVTPDLEDDSDSHFADSTTVYGDRSWYGSASSLEKKKRRGLGNNRHLGFYPRLFREMLDQSQEHHPVGVFESQQYMHIEKRNRHPHGDILEENSIRLLAVSVEELLSETGVAMNHALNWIGKVNSERFRLWGRTSWGDSVASNEQALKRLKGAMDVFYTEKRHIILEPYKGVFDPLQTSEELPPHRYLFRSFVYQYHLMRFSEGLYEMIQQIDHLEKGRRQSRLWLPLFPIRLIFSRSAWEADAPSGRADDEDPDVIPGISVKSQNLGAAVPRDADALPPDNMTELMGSRIYVIFGRLSGGTAQFALKAGLISVLLSLPNYLKVSTEFAYQHKSIWALFIAQLTLARYRGDTIFGLLSRALATVFGGLIGLAFWYISAGGGTGNAYGLAAVGVVVFPPLIFLRVYAPGPPATPILFALTIILIIGCSWQDTHGPISASQGHGWDVAWRRFLLVIIGVMAAGLLGFLPPSKTIRRYHRTALSTTSSEIGYLYCAIVSYANHRREEDRKEIMRNTMALHAKLKRMRSQTTNIQYEFSLRGKWPVDRYNAVLNLQLEIAHLLSHLMSVVNHLEPTWSRAFLQRTRFLDPAFLGNVLAVISMISTSLRTAMPLPQITPAPLLDHFWKYRHGLNVVQQEAVEDYGLPRAVTFETLQNEQYRCFSVGVSSAASIVSRLDMLMHATKELVGERFHIDGAFLPTVQQNL